MTHRFAQVVREWGEMVRFTHTVFALPFALMATFLAARNQPHGLPTIGQVVLILICMVGARSAAMTFNRIVDAAIDARNVRTAGRSIPAGRITVTQATVIFVGACVLFVVGCAGFYWLDGNYWPIVFALPVLAYLCFYSYTKRFTRYSHLVLGSAIALSPPAAWMAIDPATIGAPAIALLVAVTCWIAGFDIIYACQDVDADRRDHLHSLPATIGVGRALWIARALHVVTVAALIALLQLAALGWVYTAGVVVVAVLLVYENAIVRADDLSRVNLAFFTVNGVVSVVLAAAAITDVLLLHSHP